MGELRKIMYKIKTNEANIVDYDTYIRLTNQEFEGEAENVIKNEYDFLHILDFGDFISKRKTLHGQQRRMLETEVTGSLLGVGRATLVRNPNL